jgi:hypothetical protein
MDIWVRTLLRLVAIALILLGVAVTIKGLTGG